MTKFPNIKAVGFDLDDTLVATEEWAWTFENKVLESMGIPKMGREVHKETWGMPLYEAIQHRSPGTNPDDFRDAFTRELKKHLENNDLDILTEKITNALVELTKRSLYLFILTGRSSSEMIHLDNPDHPLLLHFRKEDIWHGGNLKFNKPDPRAFDWLWAKGFKPNEVIFVGDSTYDGLAAKGADINFVATLESGLRDKEYFKDIEVDAFIDNLNELPDLIG